jgi:hypothetical protein
MLHERTCRRCNNEFTTTNARKVHCRPDCSRAGGGHHARHARRLSNDITFVGVDGEGVDRPDGAHEYVMLSVGDQTLWRDGRALTLREILSFLWECYTLSPDAAYVGFYLGYDFIQWEKLLPERQARLLLTNDGIAERKSSRKSRANPYPDAVVVDEARWEIDIMAGRRFKLRPHVHHRSDYGPQCRNRTCPYTFDEGVDRHGDEPSTIDPREYLGFIPPEDGSGTAWGGTVKAYWKRFMPRVHRSGQHGNVVRSSAWMYICDTGPFWQTSFLKVIDPKGWPDGTAPVTEAEYDLIRRGKEGRGNVADRREVGYFDEMQMYNVLENEVLSRVTQRLNEGFMNDTIPIKIPKADWYGPGRAAQLWMDMLHVRACDPSAVEYNKYVAREKSKDPFSTLERQNETGLLNADIYMSMPAWAYDASRDSYYGGWFEQFMHGHVGDVWEYDINSAYPFIIASLPCLHTTNGHNGVYSQGVANTYLAERSNRQAYTLLHGTVRGSNPFIGAMPYRTAQGSILRPHVTKGWYWLHEIEAAKRAGLIDNVDTESWVSYVPCECRPPFDPSDIGISRMYQMRLDVGKNSPQGKAAKLVYNSAYGKTAQSIGSPKYANPFYASLITAGCRTLILDSIATHPGGAGSVAMVATDGIYFTERHPTLELSDTVLGAWDETFKPGMTQLMPGVYWDDNTRASIGLGQAPKLKSRGVNATDLAKEIANLDRRFAEQHSKAHGGNVEDYEWPEIRFRIRFLLDSAKLALQRGKWSQAGRVQHDTYRTISSNPISKRNPLPYFDHSMGLVRTRPWGGHDITHPVDSTPYRKSFGFIDEASLTVDRDGTDALSYFRELLK